LVHGRCLDSAVLFPNPRGPPFRSSLRVLAQRLLGRAIQQGAHDSCEDAEVALQAVRLKLRGGPTLGSLKQGCSHLLELLAAKRRSTALVAPREVLMLHAVPAARVVPTASDAQAVAAALCMLATAQQSPAAGDGAGKATEASGHATVGGAAHGGDAGQPASLQQPAGAQAGHAAAERPPDLLWLQLGELWQHLQERAVRLAGQVSLWQAQALLLHRLRRSRVQHVHSSLVCCPAGWAAQL
jgi:RNA exonuclease 1